MLKKILLAVAIALPMTVMAQKFGTVKTDEVFQSLPETAEMQARYTDASKQYEQQFENIKEKLNKLIADYQVLEKDPNALETIKESRRNEIDEMANKLDKYRENAYNDLNKIQQDYMAPAQQKILEAIKTVGVEGNYTFIFPNDPGLILYQGTEVVDVTAEVKAKLGIK